MMLGECGEDVVCGGAVTAPLSGGALSAAAMR
jgi:hypothetical protein